MDIIITNGFSEENPKTIIVKNSQGFTCTKNREESHTIYDFIPNHNWTIEVDFDSGNTNDRQFWVLHTTSLNGLKIVSKTKDGLKTTEESPQTNYKKIKIKSGRNPEWEVNLKNVSSAAGSGNVTIGDDNQHLLSIIITQLRKFFNLR